MMAKCSACGRELVPCWTITKLICPNDCDLKRAEPDRPKWFMHGVTPDRINYTLFYVKKFPTFAGEDGTWVRVKEGPEPLQTVLFNGEVEWKTQPGTVWEVATYA